MLGATVEDEAIVFEYHSQLYKYGFCGVLFNEACPGSCLGQGNSFLATELTRDADAMICLIEADLFSLTTDFRQISIGVVKGR